MGRSTDRLCIATPVKRFLLVALVASIVLPLVASAHHADVRDRNDTDGRFDIRLVKLNGKHPRTWRIQTWQVWSATRAWDAGFMLVYVDTFGTDRPDYYALVRSYGRGMVAHLYRDHERKRDRRISQTRVTRPNRKAVKVAIPFGQLRRRSSRIFRWYAQTLWTGSTCRRVCFDRAPDRGDVTEPGATTPSVPPTPIPTPSP